MRMDSSLFTLVKSMMVHGITQAITLVLREIVIMLLFHEVRIVSHAVLSLIGVIILRMEAEKDHLSQHIKNVEK